MPDQPPADLVPFRMPHLPLSEHERAALAARYERAAHQVQTAVKFVLAREGPTLETSACSPKHLRVGVDLRAAEARGLARLLMDKGCITEDEYLAAMTWGVEMEAAERAKVLSEKYGVPVTLG